jgi:hypothetical protein
MTEEEFERWKTENGWHFTGPDVLFFAALAVVIILIVWFA